MKLFAEYSVACRLSYNSSIARWWNRCPKRNQGKRRKNGIHSIIEGPILVTSIDYIRKLNEKEPEFKEHRRDNLWQARQEMDDNGLRKVSTTDPGSRFTKNEKRRIEPSYNPQVTVEKNGIILANDVGQNANWCWATEASGDTDRRKPRKLPDHVAWSSDAGYFGSENIQFLSVQKVDWYIPDNNEANLDTSQGEKEGNEQFLFPIILWEKIWVSLLLRDYGQRAVIIVGYPVARRVIHWKYISTCLSKITFLDNTWQLNRETW